MSDDIVTRLRHGEDYDGTLMGEAADEIERLRADLDELRHAVIQLRFERNEAADEIERLREIVSDYKKWVSGE